MSEQKSRLCVGGPQAGKRYDAILHGSGFLVPAKMETSAARPTSDPVKVEFTDYRAEVFHTPQGDVSFWVPAEQTPLETITLLLDYYENVSTAGRMPCRLNGCHFCACCGSQ
jgi:hypothetical protein